VDEQDAVNSRECQVLADANYRHKLTPLRHSISLGYVHGVLLSSSFITPLTADNKIHKEYTIKRTVPNHTAGTLRPRSAVK